MVGSGGRAFPALAAVGCAVVTGVGAVTNAAKVPPGAVVAVIGAGGVGVNVIQGAVLAGAARIIAVDREAAPLAIARQLGATHVVQPSGKTADAVKELTDGRGAEFVFDTVGSPATLTDAILSARKGGTVVVTGLSRIDAQGAIRLYPFVMQEKRLIGSVYGSGNPLQDIERLVNLHQAGRTQAGRAGDPTYRLDAGQRGAGGAGSRAGRPRGDFSESRMTRRRRLGGRLSRLSIALPSGESQWPWMTNSDNKLPINIGK